MMENFFHKLLLALFLCISIFKLSAQQDNLRDKEISYTFYALGNIGDNVEKTPKALEALKKELNKAPSNSMMLFLGNNVSTKGMSKKTGTKNLDLQIDLVKSFDGKTVFIPGYSDWKSGLKGLERQQRYIETALNVKNPFLPKNGCPIKKLKLNDDVDVILVDSQWALQDWDKFPGINVACEIRSKTEFYVELESEIKKSEGKTVLVAMYHPVISNGTASNGINLGINPNKTSNKYYKEFSNRVITIARQTSNVIFLSGHDKSLQYIKKKGIPMIVSGAGASIDKVKSVKSDFFTSSEVGFSKITQYTDGSVKLDFYGDSNNFSSPIFSKEIIGPDPVYKKKDYYEYDTPQYVYKSIYTKDELERSKFFKSLWGENYRDDYVKNIKIKTALLDTLYGGLKPLRKGGGHQTNSLRLEDKEGKQYAMRSAKKSALRFIQYFLFKTQYLDPDLEDTYFVQLLQDYWTTANPYASLTIGDLSDAIDVLHPNPELYYIPKQNSLLEYNDAYGDKIYFIEERLSDGLGTIKSLGGSDVIISSLDLYEEMRADREDIHIDEALYIRTRLFDNLIGDWDRHADQWKWAEFKNKDGSKLYKPIPRDRDQVFSDFDGFILNSLTTFSPTMRFMQKYDEHYNAIKWFNDAGDDVDLAVLKNHTKEDWLREARHIRENLNEDKIDAAFKNFPKEVNQEKIKQIKKALLGRLNNLESFAVEYYEYLIKNVLVVGTDKDDRFKITRLPEGKTRIEGYRVKKDNAEEKFWDVTYDKDVTREIWIYGLADSDTFEVIGEGTKNIHVKIIGGSGNDTYSVLNKRNLKVYDQKSKSNTFKTKVSKNLSDDYETNTYYFKTHRRDVSSFLPLPSFNPDNGLGIGGVFNYTKNSLLKDPFTDKHQIKAQYFFETSGFDVSYNSEYAGIFNNVNLGFYAGFSSPNFTSNFFGFGNETVNNDDDLDLNFNRVRIQNVTFAPSLIFRGYQGSVIKLGVSYENIKVEKTQGRFIDIVNVNPNVFDGQDFLGVNASYEYENFDSSLAKKGIGFKLTTGYKLNSSENKGYGYVIPEIKFTTSLIKQGRLVLATKVKSHFNLGNDFEFYQAATLGDLDGLRGFRQQRFSGKQSFYHQTDFRTPLGRLRNKILPIGVGIYGGFDYGRVWLEGENSNKWHSSYGGGIYMSIGGFTNLNVAYFTSSEGARFVFGLEMPF